jgi:hypothetical protein
MKTWQNLTSENSLLNGRPARQHPDLWRRLLWESAAYHPLPCGTVLKVRMRGGAVAHVVSPDPLALALEPGKRAVPIALPAFNDLPAPPHGFVWFLADTSADARPAPAPFADMIGA